MGEAENASDPISARASAEEAERKRWAESFGAVLLYSDAPVALGIAPDRVALVVGKRRPRTLRARLRTAQKLSNFTMLAFGRVWHAFYGR